MMLLYLFRLSPSASTFEIAAAVNKVSNLLSDHIIGDHGIVQQLCDARYEVEQIKWK